MLAPVTEGVRGRLRESVGALRGVFANGRGTWLTTLRRGNLDVLADELDSDIGQPQYVDFFNKLSYAVSPRSQLRAGILGLDDKISLNDAGNARGDSRQQRRQNGWEKLTSRQQPGAFRGKRRRHGPVGSG